MQKPGNALPRNIERASEWLFPINLNEFARNQWKTTRPGELGAALLV